MRRWQFLKSVAGAIIACLLGANYASSAEPQLWGYEEDTAPENWGKLSADFHACGAGVEQSPIDLSGAKIAALPQIKLNWHSFAGELANNGHTIEVELTSGGTISVEGSEYRLEGIHFHAPSEHRLEGMLFPMEMHFVHRHTETNALAVLGVFVASGGENASFSKLMHALPEKVGEKYAGPTDISLETLVPETRAYWSYSGSLTTPPCSEPVSWMIFREPLLVGEKDIDAFRSHYPMNARPVQKLYDRSILLSD